MRLDEPNKAAALFVHLFLGSGLFDQLLQTSRGLSSSVHISAKYSISLPLGVTCAAILGREGANGQQSRRAGYESPS